MGDRRGSSGHWEPTESTQVGLVHFLETSLAPGVAPDHRVHDPRRVGRTPYLWVGRMGEARTDPLSIPRSALARGDYSSINPLVIAYLMREALVWRSSFAMMWSRWV